MPQHLVVKHEQGNLFSEKIAYKMRYKYIQQSKLYRTGSGKYRSKEGKNWEMAL